VSYLETFRYLAVMVSMILGFGVTRLLGGIGNLLQVRSHVRSYWLHSVWIVMLILFHVDMWWWLWAVRRAENWTSATFLYVLLGPASLVIASQILMPGGFYGEAHKGEFDLRDHYFDSSRLFFGILAAATLWTMCLEPVLGVQGAPQNLRLVQGFELAALLTCAFSRERAVHVIATTVTLGAMAYMMFVVRLRVGSFDLG
jgi:hypothetical protein